MQITPIREKKNVGTRRPIRFWIFLERVIVFSKEEGVNVYNNTTKPLQIKVCVETTHEFT